jgi:putative methyltransferase
MKSIYFFQCNYSAKFGEKTQYWLPYSVGCLWAYAQQFDDIKLNWEVKGKIYRRDPIDSVLKKIENPTVCVFSCYCWNEQYNLNIAKKIKELWPDTWIVFGGPQSGSNHLKYNFIDSIVFGEGEESFLEILRTIDADKIPQELYTKKRLDNLEIPSPYLIGFFDDIIAESPGDYFQGVLETNRGCPYSCTFCDWGSTTYGKVKRFNLERVQDEIKWVVENPITTLFITDANFGAFKERDLEIATMLEKYSRDSCLEYVNVTYAKNSNEHIFKVAKALGSLGRGVTLSVQSMNTKTLKTIKRDNMASNDLKNMYALSHQYGVTTYTEVILGLPEETLETFIDGISELLELGQHTQCEMYLANVMENTELNQTQKFQYGIKTIRCENYQPFSFNDLSSIPEYTDLVCETNTMSKNDLTDAYMFHWVVQNFHYQGWSQIISKYCRHVLGIPYKELYIKFLNFLKQDTGILGDEYREVEKNIKHLFNTGSLLVDIPVHHFNGKSHALIYDNFETVLLFIIDFSKSFGHIDSTIIEIQKRFVANLKYLPLEYIESNYNLENWEKTKMAYKIECQVKDFIPTYTNIWILRRSGKLKNKITELAAETLTK